ncbi:interferon alpha-inducible protein 27-like protein 2 isoform X1 [Loxodonta africana]|uniref:interferon alpha-inducible protein 27-like protein 2 isoform X1 n=1 Tax=Loxodonta africana TaxID=9785 RepID=UPI000C81294C|nr:interferon alpha-inducible protein 27-like protein 2 isoform X1 [Loxodonta africana]
MLKRVACAAVGGGESPGPYPSIADLCPTRLGGCETTETRRCRGEEGCQPSLPRLDLLAVAVAAVPVTLSAIGFTGAGIAASSIAAKMMSAAAIANGGGVAAGSLVATLQSVGAAGLSASSNILLGFMGSAVGAWLGGSEKKPPPPPPDEPKTDDGDSSEDEDPS